MYFNRQGLYTEKLRLHKELYIFCQLNSVQNSVVEVSSYGLYSVLIQQHNGLVMDVITTRNQKRGKNAMLILVKIIMQVKY